jgi:hypothetical protein
MSGQASAHLFFWVLRPVLAAAKVVADKRHKAWLEAVQGQFRSKKIQNAAPFSQGLCLY